MKLIGYLAVIGFVAYIAMEVKNELEKRDAARGVIVASGYKCERVSKVEQVTYTEFNISCDGDKPTHILNMADKSVKKL